MIEQEKISLLIIHSSDSEALVLGELIQLNKNIEYDIYHVSNLKEAYGLLDETFIDIILVDLLLEDSIGIQTFNQLYTRYPDIPFIVLTDINNDIIGKNAVNKGAQDYLIKSELNKNTLNRVIGHSIERKKFEKQLRKSEEKYKELFIRSKDAIYMSTVEGEFIDINPAGLSLFGYSMNDIDYLKVKDLYVNKNDRIHLIETLGKRGEVEDYEVELVKKDRVTKLNCLLTTSVIKNEDQAVIGYQGIIKDITAKKNAEEALFRSLRDLDQANKELNYLNTNLEEKVIQRTAQLKKEKEKVEFQNKEITESIRYAKRIQASILPSDEKIKNGFNDFFIYYEPKDIVSGDFYWFEEDEDNHPYLAIVDCTGHGVPGAFMSIIGYTQLNDIIKEKNSQDLGLLLEELDKRVQAALNQDKQMSSKDGMELGIMSFDKKSKTLYYAGAMRPLYYVRDNEVQVIKGDKFSIGGTSRRKKVFTTHEIKTQKSDVAYLFSDGYPDQFGGPLGKKFMTKNVARMLAHIAHLPTREQKEIVIKSMDDWMKNEEQVDDILIAGVKF